MSKVVHRRKFENVYGVTPNEMHRREVWGGKRCAGCGSEKVGVEIRVLIPWSEVNPMVRAAVELEAARTGEPLPVFQVKGGVKMTCASKVYACDGCRRTAERVAARKAPSYAVVEIDGGPEEVKPTVQVAGWETSGRSLL